MGRIFAQAQKEILNRNLDKILSEIKKMQDNPDNKDFSITKRQIMERIDAIFADNEQEISESTRDADNWGDNGWDFSTEKSKQIFAENVEILIRPFLSEDAEFYTAIREQYRVFEKNVPKEQLISGYWIETQQDSAFYCIIESCINHTEMGYIALKNTAKNLWEIAIELDRAYCGKGYGPAAIALFLDRVREITGENQFQALVEVDNIPCQNCMRKIKASLVGLQRFSFYTEEDAENFESRHLDMITDHMRVLAEKLQVVPQKLLSHVLDYRIVL